jgi:hypothetical protein
MSYAPDTLTRPGEWYVLAECRDLPELFIERDRDAEGLAMAREICAACPVRTECLAAAMVEEGSDDSTRRAGIRGGLTPTERGQLSRRIRTAPPAEHSRILAEVQAAQERTPRTVFEERTVALAHGHTAWLGIRQVTIAGRMFTPGQLAWHTTHDGTPPVGRLFAECGLPGCVTPGHLVDRGAKQQTNA